MRPGRTLVRISRFLRLALTAAVAVSLTACAEDSLIDLGSRSSGWIGERQVDDTEVVVEPGATTVPAGAVDWYNDDLGRPAADAAVEQVVAEVAERASGAETYIQASRYEIAAALTDLGFPAVLPIEVVAVTSQLVLIPSGERLDDQVKAAFGFWTVEPYSKSRSVGQRGTLVVHALHPTPPCDRLAPGAAGSCTFLLVEGKDVLRVDSESGQTWVWSDDLYEYQLFLRGSFDINDPRATEMLGSIGPFRTVFDPTVSQVTSPDQ
jgi:hypothetical protein